MSDNKSGLLKPVTMVFGLIVIGKFLALGREIVFSSLFGTSILADAYFAATTIPNMLNIPLTVSTLIFFIPIYNQCRIEEGRKGRRNSHQT